MRVHPACQTALACAGGVQSADLSMHGQRQRPAGAVHLRDHVQSRPWQQQRHCRQAPRAASLAACHSGDGLSCGGRSMLRCCSQDASSNLSLLFQSALV